MKIEKEGMTIEDSMDKLIETEDGITCGCENPILSIVTHIDGRDFYGYTYNCENCGNVITTHCKRSKDDLMYWG